MTQFLDCRLSAVGGGLTASVSLCQGTSIGGYGGLSLKALSSAIEGRHVLVATHGFNVWPGDSVWAHGLDYPEEPKIADQTGSLLAQFIDAHFQQAASLSFASHSLGARVVLATISHLRLPVRRLTIMAGAVDDDCLTTEFKAAAARVVSISILVSKKDEVLSVDFPLGNFLAGIIAAGHPWWRAALGHCGPRKPWPENLLAPFEIPDNWNFQHGNYLQINKPPARDLPIPVDVPPPGSPPPGLDPAGQPVSGWQEAFSSAFASTRFR
jgi:hypothetical protein